MLGLFRKHGWPISIVTAAAGGLALAIATSRPPPPFLPVAASEGGLPRLGSEAQFRAYLAQRNARIVARRAVESDAVMMEVAADAAAAPAADAAADAGGITNVQEAGVDEGGIVKSAGDHLVILRRGRLFTVSTADGGMRTIDTIDVNPPGARPPRNSWDGAWYDEMLVVGDRVVVIGYSYEKQGTEIIRFRKSKDGRLAFEDVSRLRASDYYSAENYASRLIGSELVLYNVQTLDGENPDAVLPALVDETPGRSRTPQRLTRPEDVFIDPEARPRNLAYGALHSITRCDLAAPRLDCEATAVIGPWSRSFYVSPRAIYLWTSAEGRGEDRVAATVYRMPLDGGRPQAVRVAGAPLDQFSFREDPARGRLDVLVLSNGGGDAMWSRDSRDGAAALLRLPLSRFGDGEERARASDFRDLPDLPHDGWQRHNRFVGDHLLYAVDRHGPGGYDDRSGVLLAADVDGGPAQTFELAAPVSRLEPLARDALVVTGDDSGMDLVVLDLAGARARLGARYSLALAGEAESRSHGFFYRPDGAGAFGGLLGLPVMRFLAAGRTEREPTPTVDMLFVRRSPGALSDIGQLSARRGKQPDDHCQVSCVDWYGNARPIFLRGRIFALMGYELVEGRLEDGSIREIGRLDFTPRG